MNSKITHRRLYAFFNSNVLNALIIVLSISLLQFGYIKSIEIPTVFSTIAIILFIGYTLWFLIKRPAQIVINRWLSNIDSWFTLYLLIILALNPENQWWYIAPAVCAIIVLFINLIKPHDEKFEI